MAWIAEHHLAAAVSKAGGLGMDSPLAGLPAANGEQKQQWLERFRALGAANVILSQ